MADEHGFLGIPTKTFDEGGRRQLISLLREGLSPESRVCEIGCGCLRVAYWLIQLLEPGGYCGIEPHKGRVEWGRTSLFNADLLEIKKPRFHHNADFDTSVFGGKFDFFLAGSIWTHCSKAHIQTMLDGFVAHTVPDAVFLVSYLAARSDDEDYMGSVWVGTSHESNEAGIVRHKLSWIEDECARRGLVAEEVTGPAFDAQTWLRVRRRNAAPRVERIED